MAQQWERTNITAWNFGDLPERITVSENGPVPVYAWPGLALEKDSVSLRLFRTEDLAKQASLGGIQKLVELALAKDFAWLHRDLRALAANLCPLEELHEAAYENLKRHVMPAEIFWPLTGAEFAKAVQQTRLEIPGLAQKLIDQVGPILRARKEIEVRCGSSPVLLAAPKRSEGGPTSKPKTLSDLSQLSIATKDAVKPANLWAHELDALLPRNFLATIPFNQLTHLPRYLKALATRMERAKLNPVKDKERAQQLAPYLAALKKFEANPPKATEARRRLEEFRWMVEEYKVSLFAQELGTAAPVSRKRLDEQRQRLTTGFAV